MAHRTTSKQSRHDDTVAAVATIYRREGKDVVTNPGSDKNEEWNGYYIDVIARKPGSFRAWVIEIETEDSITDSEAENQWKDYGNAYSAWYLAVPKGNKQEALSLLRKHEVKNCKVAIWQRNSNGEHTFWGLPGPSV